MAGVIEQYHDYYPAIVPLSTYRRLAAKWINRQTQVLQESWVRLTGGLKARFPKAAKVDHSQYALQRLLHLKQKGRSLEKYFGKVRNIERDLPTELGLQIVNQMLAGLDDQIIRKVVGVMCGEGRRTVSHVIRMIESASGDKETESKLNIRYGANRRDTRIPVHPAASG